LFQSRVSTGSKIARDNTDYLYTRFLNTEEEPRRYDPPIETASWIKSSMNADYSSVAGQLTGTKIAFSLNSDVGDSWEFLDDRRHPAKFQHSVQSLA
jgi:hypothetical protein